MKYATEEARSPRKRSFCSCARHVSRLCSRSRWRGCLRPTPPTETELDRQRDAGSTRRTRCDATRRDATRRNVTLLHDRCREPHQHVLYARARLLSSCGAPRPVALLRSEGRALGAGRGRQEIGPAVAEEALCARRGLLRGSTPARPSREHWATRARGVTRGHSWCQRNSTVVILVEAAWEGAGAGCVCADTGDRLYRFYEPAASPHN